MKGENNRIDLTQSQEDALLFDRLHSLPLPELPSVIRYYDDFVDEYRSIRNPKDEDVWILSVGGDEMPLDFMIFYVEFRYLLKHWIAFLIQTLAPGTVSIRFVSLLKVSKEDLWCIVSASPTSIRPHWQALFAKGYTVLEMASLKSILHFFCKFNLYPWSPDYSDFLSTLPLPAVDKYASVRTGDVFLSVEEEAILISYFDDMTRKVLYQPESVSDYELRDVAILVCSFQFGLRPMQIGMLQMGDVRVWSNVDGAQPSVHLVFKMIKQQSRARALPLPRKVKHDWAPLFVELYNRGIRKGLDAGDRIFQTNSSRETAAIIIRVTGALLPDSRSATELRHTAAQRLVDAGASQEEVTEFLGHSDTDTCLVYFQTSPNQSERVNRALGISEIYQQVVKIAHDRFISSEELAELKGEQQIGGAPHGLPITGIGGCSTGQPSCPSNPVIACYGCRKFMPLYDVKIHQKALEDFRGVVILFSETSRGDFNSPAYLQLKRTISSIQGIIAEIEEGHP